MIRFQFMPSSSSFKTNQTLFTFQEQSDSRHCSLFQDQSDTVHFPSWKFSVIYLELCCPCFHFSKIKFMRNSCFSFNTIQLFVMPRDSSTFCWLWDWRALFAYLHTHGWWEDSANCTNWVVAMIDMFDVGRGTDSTSRFFWQVHWLLVKCFVL